MVYIDKFGHLVSDENNVDFRIMKKFLGVSNDQFINCNLPHYTLTPEQAARAVVYGARYVSETELIDIINENPVSHYESKAVLAV